jgi:predicted AAA+ superfamily ATPase
MDNYQRIGSVLTQLRDGLRPYVERELSKKLGKYWVTKATEGWQYSIEFDQEDQPKLDALALLRMMQDNWNNVFSEKLGHADRSHVNELRQLRNDWAHVGGHIFSNHETLRAMETTVLLLRSVSAPQLSELEKERDAFARIVYPTETAEAPAKQQPTLLRVSSTSDLKPWRKVVSPHVDVQNGTLRQAEFAADLQQVLDGTASREYMEPAEFYQRTYLTDSLSDMLISAIKRLNGEKVDPVIQLQTNFGGGKTHSMLALYHLFGGTPVDRMPGVPGLLKQAGYTTLPKVSRAVLVGTRLQAGTPSVYPDGVTVNTIWGEMAYQLGGKEGYQMVKDADQTATNPGKALGKLFERFGPCLILMDEWVAYARQLHERNDLCGGSFDTQFTFAQALTEEITASKNCLVLVSVPVSDRNDSRANDIEIGGKAGSEALDRLRNVVARVESSWRPATTEESFEIVRRRLFQPIETADQIAERDKVAHAYVEYYRANKDYFPTEAQSIDYEERLKKAYPIHPELFDRLYTDWGTSPRFQRTRGVLRLMASVIHHLWKGGHNQALILPSDIAISDEDVQSELTRNLTENWRSVIEKDIDGDGSLPEKMDNQNENYGKTNATRRIARALFMGSAPLVDAQRKGMDYRKVLLGSVPIGEAPASFSDALNKLALNATYLYQDKELFWYALSPTVSKLAADRQREVLKDKHRVKTELERRLRTALMERGDFDKIHILPDTSADVIDEETARLVVLGKESAHKRGGGSLAVTAVRQFVTNRGNSPRRFRNALVFLAPDATAMTELEDSISYYIAWQSIVLESDPLNLTSQQKRNAEENTRNREGEVLARLAETYSWLLAPIQDDPKGNWEVEEFRIQGQQALAVKASQKLREQDLLVASLAGSILRQHMDKYSLWGGNHCSVRDLVDYYATYTFLPRLKSPQVLLSAISAGTESPTWEKDTFAIADAYDQSANRYLSLTGGKSRVITDLGSTLLLVKPEVALAQIEAEKPVPVPPAQGSEGGGTGSGVGSTPVGTGSEGGTKIDGPITRKKPRRYHGSVTLKVDRPTKHINDVMNEVVGHLSGLVGAKMTIQVEISATVPDGFEEQVIRTVIENGKVLGFSSNDFEED